ncbi:MAG: hypothetical protein A2X45_10040 [Lentisphaerae bacterium GWF2_50_93]|nr:MAG: hypothetical protein A2X45_10040 [Lentisphaerae bacterium GWF2_50_93]
MALVEEKDVPRYLLLTGELRAEKESSVATDAAGIVVLASIERGMSVKKGDVLVKLDDRNAILAVREAEANLKSARADYEHARKDLERNEQLAKVKAVSDSSFQKAKANHDISAASLSVAEVRLDKAEKNLADCTVSAPFTGFVAERKVQIGEYVQSGTVVARLVEVDTLRLSLNVPETAVGSLYVGQEVSFTVGAYPDRTFSGKIKHVGAAVRDNSRDLVIEAEIANSDRLLKPGMFVSARLVLTPAISMVVPGNAIRTEGANSHVFVVQDGHAVEKLVETGVPAGSGVEIRGGLKPGEKVVLDPDAGLKDGSQVRM